jgi:hypothetical protein
MRVVLWLVVVVAGALAPRQSLAQSAYDYPICSFYEGSEATSCYYQTYEQCMATVSGIGGHCYQNPAYRPRPVVEEPPRRRGRRN